MKNTPVGEGEAKDLRERVAKVLRHVGNPDPPLDLLVIREALDLDVGYYSLRDPSLLQEVVHRVKVGVKQFARRPTLLLDVARSAKLSGFWIPDGRKIRIDEDAPKSKHRWIEAHEVGHGLAPWHSRYLFGESEETLSLSFHEEMEREANFVAGQLLFLQERFQQEALDGPPRLKSVLDLATAFGNTKTSTLWRFVEQGYKGKPLVGLVSPNPGKLGPDFDPSAPCRYCVESPEFRSQFGTVTEVELFELLRSYCRRAPGGPLGKSEVALRDRNGQEHMFRFESWSNTYDVLTLGAYLQPRKVLVGI